jgi:Skp family chaperone for outer membrane proteins
MNEAYAKSSGQPVYSFALRRGLRTVDRHRASFLCFALTVAVSLSSPAFSQEGQHKIGIVNRKVVYDSYNKQLDERTKLEKELEKEKSDLVAREETLKKQREDYESKKDSMSDEQKQQEQEQLQAAYNKLVADGKTAQDKLDSRSRQLVRDLREEIDAAVKDIGAKENFHIILEGDPIASSVLYFSTTMDLTSKVTQVLNDRYGPRKSSGGASSGAAAAPAQDKDTKKKK